uniref:Uncharacterized protein n=1 Tax=Cucumis melo TaxID=3656 RepID=A0A9I9E8S9_CUCME
MKHYSYSISEIVWITSKDGVLKPSLITKGTKAKTLLYVAIIVHLLSLHHGILHQDGDHPYYRCFYGIMHQNGDHLYYQCFYTHQTPVGLSSLDELKNLGNLLQCKRLCLQNVPFPKGMSLSRLLTTWSSSSNQNARFVLNPNADLIASLIASAVPSTPILLV